MHRLRSTFASEATGEAWERSLHERILQREMEFVPADTLNPEPTPDFKIDEAPSSRVPEVQETTSNTKGPSQSIDPIDPDELALSLSRSLAGAGFGASSDPDPSASSNEIVSASGADQE
jgi:hypothetical protein